jgi:hypothetical protein
MFQPGMPYLLCDCSSWAHSPLFMKPIIQECVINFDSQALTEEEQSTIDSITRRQAIKVSMEK